MSGSAKRSLPVTWSTPGHATTIAAPSAAEQQLYADPRRTTCGSCRHFRHEAGQAAMAKQRFIERLVIEEQWKVRHLGCSPKDYGYCQEAGASTITSLHAKSCDHYTPKRGFIGIGVKE